MTQSLTLHVDGPNGLISDHGLERLAELVAKQVTERLTEETAVTGNGAQMTMSLDEVCDALRVDGSTIHRWQVQGKFPPPCCARPKVWRRVAIQEWMIAQENEAAVNPR